MAAGMPAGTLKGGVPGNVALALIIIGLLLTIVMLIAGVNLFEKAWEWLAQGFIILFSYVKELFSFLYGLYF